MADIQPKNTTTIRVDKIKEKTSSAQVNIHDSVSFANGAAATPVSATIDLGATTSGATHFRALYAKTVGSSGQDMALGTLTAHLLNIITNNTTKWAFNAADLIQDATNGGHLKMTKTSTALAVATANGLTAAGTTISDALALTSVFNKLSSVSASTGVKLWDAPIGSIIYVLNQTATAVLVYPHSASGTHNGGSAGASVSIAANSWGIFVRQTSTNWDAMEQTVAVA